MVAGCFLSSSTGYGSNVGTMVVGYCLSSSTGYGSSLGTMVVGCCLSSSTGSCEYGSGPLVTTESTSQCYIYGQLVILKPTGWH
jgi:hypothetical protein